MADEKETTNKAEPAKAQARHVDVAAGLLEQAAVELDAVTGTRAKRARGLAADVRALAAKLAEF